MFQNFSGSSRRPRQVNLSGQNLNPFAAASGTQQSIAHAQQERLQRQQERDRINAAKKLQRTWRGHCSRRDLANERRKEWDELETCQNLAAARSSLLAQLRLLVSFFNTQRKDDLERIVKISSRVTESILEDILAFDRATNLIVRLIVNSLQALHIYLPECPLKLFQFVVMIIDLQPLNFAVVSKKYYTYLSRLCTLKILPVNHDNLLTALRKPLTQHIEMVNNYVILDAYASFGMHFLTTPGLENVFDQLEEISSIANICLLSSALISEFSKNTDQIESEGKLWLLAYFILLSRLQLKSIKDSDYLKALSLQLSALSGNYLSKIENLDPVIDQDAEKNENFANHTSCLPKFVSKELLSLVTRESISDLLTTLSYDPDYVSTFGETCISLFAGYALTLLRIFPRRGDEIRMWLYLGSIKDRSGVSLPTLKFFWQAVRVTNLFSSVSTYSEIALFFLHKAIKKDVELGVNDEKEWLIVLLFLELYAFVLRFTDDEEFLSGSIPDISQGHRPMSRFRQSALPIEDVKQLTLFLKHFAFAMYFFAFDLLEDVPTLNEGYVGAYMKSSSITSKTQTRDAVSGSKGVLKQYFAGISGISFKYVKNSVTGVMCMLYERDSRRKFLSKDHWLITYPLDMEDFIPAIAMEEERQHKLRQNEEEYEADESEDFETRENSETLSSRMVRQWHAFRNEASRISQSKLSQQKALYSIGPRLEVLQHMPFVIPFDTRVEIFRQFVLLDQIRRRSGHVDPDMWRRSILMHPTNQLNSRRLAHEELGRHHAKIRRTNMFEDAYQQLYGLGDELKEPIQITFVDQFDTVEAGIDGGGVTKEFLTCVTNEALRTRSSRKLFIPNDQNLLYPNPTVLDEERESLKQEGHLESSSHWGEKIRELLQQYEFLGRIIGKCLYEGILVDITFAGFFLLKWATSSSRGSEYRANINDLRDLDEGLYQGLLKLKNYDGNVEDFSLDFTITDTIPVKGGSTKTITKELVKNGSAISVTNENRPLYVSYIARHRLQVQPYQQTQAFLKGLSDVINPTWISMFNQSELQTLISGDSSEIDVEDLRRNTLYGGVYQIGDDGEEHYTIKLFWKVMKAFDDSDRRKVLKYATSIPRAPLLGFSQLNPLFSIRDSGDDEDRLPSTSTCVNLLKLPRYSSEDILRWKLLYAVNSGAGFDLS